MNPSPFSPRQSEPPTFVQRLFRRRPARNALVDIVRLLEEADSPRAVLSEHLDRIGAGYRVDVRAAFRADLEQMYREFLVHCLVDRRLSAEEVADLDHLRHLFGLDAASCDTIQRNVARQVYLHSIADVLADGAIDESERAFLGQLREQLAIPEAVAENFVDVKRRQFESRNRQPH